MAKKKLRVVLVGCGGMANGWVNVAKTFPEVELVGLVDIRAEAAQAMAQRHNLSSAIYPDLATALREAKPDAVFDVTIPDAHDQVTIAALKAGCHVLGEKPMTMSLAKAKKMVATAQQSGRIYSVIQNRRYQPQLRAVRKSLASGKLGAVEEIHIDFFIGAHFGGFRDQMDYPLILDMAIHTFDAARYLAGADPVAVYCHSFNPKRSWYKGDASAVVIFEMAGGLVIDYRGSWCAEGLQSSWESNWRVVANKGTLLWDGKEKIEAALVTGKDGFTRQTTAIEVPVPPIPHGGHEGVMADFLKAVRTGKAPETTCQDNIKSLAMVLAAVESAKTGKRVKVKW